MLGGVSKPFEIDVDDIVRGHWTTRDDGKQVPGFFIKGRRWGYALDPEARIPSLPMLKAIIKHPINLGSK